jgi:hypothetical protein
MNHFRGETCKKGRETGEERACVPRFWQFGEQEFVFRVVFIGPQVFKTKDANDSEGLGYGLRPVVNVLESLSLRIGYAKRMLVAVSGAGRTPDGAALVPATPKTIKPTRKSHT